MGRIADLIERMAKIDASDLHIQIGEKPFYRINGILLRSDEHDEIKSADMDEFVSEELHAEQAQQFDEEGHLDFSHCTANTRVRATLYRQRGMPGASFRLIPPDIPTLEELHLPAVIKDIALLQRGLVLVCGPTGCGKTTTLAAMVEFINNSKNCHIVTIEDPIEFSFENRQSLIQQRQVGADTEDFASGLREALRQDPDVILVGEMRDLETIYMALLAAETGHLVLSTVHTSGAANTINRIIDAFPIGEQQQVRTQLSLTLQAVVSQILLLRRDRTGRIPAVEVMIVDPSIRNMIRENKVHQIDTALTSGKLKGNISLDQSLKRLIEDDVIEPSVGVDFARDPGELTELFS
jgi:twitching motility protein PilT